MSDSRRRAHITSDDESDHTSRNVRPRRSIFPDDPYLEHTHRTEESDPEEEPFEDEEEPHPIPPSTSHPVPSPAASPVPSSPIVPASPIPHPPPPAALLWDWMPRILDWWRRDEQIPVLPQITEPPTPIPPFTKEAVHETVPVLITRLRSHERILEWLEKKVRDRTDAPAKELEELHQQVLGVESELAEMRDEVVTTHTRGIQTRDEVVVLRQEQDATRQRLAALEEEVAALKAEREQFKADAASSARFCDLLGDMTDLLR